LILLSNSQPTFIPTAKFMTQEYQNQQQQHHQQRFATPFQLSQASNVASVQSNATPVMRGKSNLPAFLNKLYGMVNSSDTDPWVCWNEDGTSFIIPNNNALAEHVLGRHFKHNNFNSFVRQLNMYGFHKVPHLNHGVLHNNGLPEVWEFTNEHFLRDKPEAMRNIIRKKGEAEKARSAAKQRSTSSTSPQLPHQLDDPRDMAILKAEIQSVATRQALIKEEMFRLSSNTESLWKYALETRQRTQQQQEKIDKMIKFLSEIFIKQQRANNGAELTGKVKGLLEGPTVEELSSEAATPQSTASMEQAQKDMMMKQFANGKLPLGLKDIWEQFLSNQYGHGNNFPSTPATPATPATLDSSDALTMYQHDNSMGTNTGHVLNWLDHSEPFPDPPLNGLGIDMNGSSFSDYLHDAATFDTFNAATHPDPLADQFLYSVDPTVGQSWDQYLDTDPLHNTAAPSNNKRAFVEDDEDISSKKARVL